MNAPFRPIDTHQQARLRVEDYLLLDEHGAFGEAKTELIDGIIYYMNAQWTRHARTKSRLSRMLGNRLEELGSDLEAISEVSVRVADDGLPQPDIVLTRFEGDRIMTADTVALAVEVAETTLSTDLGRKAALYAAAGIPEYWVVDLDGGRVIVHDGPREDRYEFSREVPLGAVLASATIGRLEVDTADLVG